MAPKKNAKGRDSQPRDVMPEKKITDGCFLCNGKGRSGGMICPVCGGLGKRVRRLTSSQLSA